MSLKIGVIVGSTRPVRVGRKVADWFIEQVKSIDGMEFELIDLADVKLPFLDEPKLPAQGDYVNQHTKDWSATIGAFDGFVFVTPEYNHSFPASLKNAIDSLYAEWAKKPVAFVGYGVMGATAAIEQLVNVTAQLQMVPIVSKAIKLIDGRAILDESGNVNEAVLRGSKIEDSMADLKWWAEVLKAARGKD
jgi:NAD(P)H-dependent FMN reductase